MISCNKTNQYLKDVKHANSYCYSDSMRLRYG